MMNDIKLKIMLTLLVGLGVLSLADADPCGMVPPIFTGPSPITRIGLQKTYVFHKDGVESFVIRPGFSGKVDNFGMLIPFPNPPELRKVADDVFEHVANAVDPPEVVVDLRIRIMQAMAADAAPAGMGGGGGLKVQRNEVRVLKEEAVGMYEVAVLEAGSAAALKTWMDQNKYQYPDGMDDVCEDYVDEGWCFVAVKTKVGTKSGADPKPGARAVNPQMPDGSVFDGNVQGMGFRFKSEELVVPMRLSAFNEGELRNVVYLLTDGPRKIRSIPEEYVMRQIPGDELIRNVTQPLPLRIIGGTEKDIPAGTRASLKERRNPEPKNGIARDLFASDLLAVESGQLSLRHEEQEKELLRIGEHFGLRGAEVDRENSEALREERDKTNQAALSLLDGMTLTVVDGDFPREVIARDNLRFAEYRMPPARNRQMNYSAPRFGPIKPLPGILKVGAIDWDQLKRPSEPDQRPFWYGLHSLVVVGLIGVVGTLIYRRPGLGLGLLLATAILASTASAWGATVQESDQAWISQLQDSKTAPAAIESLVAAAGKDDTAREKIVADLLAVATQDESLTRRGWAIAALAEIGGQDVDEYLLNIHADDQQQQIVRTWAAAARVSMTRTVNGLIEKAGLVSTFPALGRPIGVRIVEKLSSGDENVDPEKVLSVTTKVPQLATALAPMVMNFGAEPLVNVMVTSKDQNLRRMAAGYLASMANEGQKDEVSAAVLSALDFDGQADSVPWESGPLFVPSVGWKKEDATQLVDQLIRWYLWCDIAGKTDQGQQIHNNLRSLSLAQAVGYQSPGWREVGIVEWLKAYGAAAGKDRIAAILAEQNVGNDARYAAVLDQL